MGVVPPVIDEVWLAADHLDDPADDGVALVAGRWPNYAVAFRAQRLREGEDPEDFCLPTFELPGVAGPFYKPGWGQWRAGRTDEFSYLELKPRDWDKLIELATSFATGWEG